MTTANKMPNNMKANTTMLHLLDEGDKFQFANEDGTVKSKCMYYVEGQYPRFKCTTICNATFIGPDSFGNEQVANIVTAVDDTQWVILVTKKAVRFNHKITFLR